MLQKLSPNVGGPVGTVALITSMLVIEVILAPGTTSSYACTEEQESCAISLRTRPGT